MAWSLTTEEPSSLPATREGTGSARWHKMSRTGSTLLRHKTHDDDINKRGRLGHGMCGIFLEVTSPSRQEDDAAHYLDQRLEALLSTRGPDRRERKELHMADRKVLMYASVLWLRGPRLTPQPLVGDDSGHALLWNGDVFAYERAEDAPPSAFSLEVSDTQELFGVLEKVDDAEVPHVLSCLRGPHALIYIRPERAKLWFCRDRLGRHSLLVDAARTTISSVGLAGSDFVEVPALGVFEQSFVGEESTLVLHPWSEVDVDIKDVSVFGCEVSRQRLGAVSVVPKAYVDTEVELESWVTRAVEEVWPVHKVFDAFMQSEYGYRDAEMLLELLREAVGTRLQRQPGYCKACMQQELHQGRNGEKCLHAKVGILFSGGLDSTVLAALADDVMEEGEPIDLVNVAFELSEGDFDTPDRLTAVQALGELRRLRPSRTFTLQKVDVSRKELGRERGGNVLADLLHPAKTVLDDSIGCALWFAARGSGGSRVLLLGSGADEQLAGYARHRGRFTNGGWGALTDEIRMEVARISSRNLGRDNRVIAHHGVAPRYPYLDEKVVAFLSSLPTHRKADLRLPRGVGEKLLLRGLAHRLLDLPLTAAEPKRAIQFGSRIAKMENRKEKGSDVAVRTNNLSDHF